MFASDSTGHDLYHLRRVLNLALHLQRHEGGDRLVIAAAALLHDVHRIMQRESGHYCAPKDSLPAVRTLLDATPFPDGKKDHVLHCVAYHEEYAFSATGKTVDDLETWIVQDADNLDALGAIGVGRTFAYGGAYGLPMWMPEAPFDREDYDDAETDPSVLHHFHSKLLRLKDTMNTETARRMAARRHAFMKRFVDEFIAEWSGEQ